MKENARSVTEEIWIELCNKTASGKKKEEQKKAK